MQIPDLINGSFELIGGVVGWLNVYKLYKDKAVKGIYWPLSLFYLAWGLWNLGYYPYLNQPASFWGGVFMVTSCLAWLKLAVKYRDNSTQK